MGVFSSSSLILPEVKQQGLSSAATHIEQLTSIENLYIWPEGDHGSYRGRGGSVTRSRYTYFG